MGKLLEVKNISKIYKDGNEKVYALDNVSFDLDQGQELVIVGASGAGKTTLLEIISGLNKPTKGQVLIEGKNIHKGSDSEISKFRNEKLGFVFQMMHLQDYFTAIENVTLPLIAKGVKRKEAKERAIELLKSVGLEKRMSHHPRQLSGGEMQRVAIARALANEPKIIMADEPTGTLDRKNTQIVLKIFFNIAKSKEVSIIMITHDEKVANVFRNVIRMEHGQIA